MSRVVSLGRRRSAGLLLGLATLTLTLVGLAGGAPARSAPALSFRDARLNAEAGTALGGLESTQTSTPRRGARS